jgi:hypothetical protein
VTAAAALAAALGAALAAVLQTPSPPIPLLAGCSDAQIGALNAESFAERIISGANLVMGKGNTLLSDKYLEMLVVLRMNRKFMEHMRDHYGNELKMLSEFQAE